MGGGKSSTAGVRGEVEKQSFSFSFLFLDTNLGGKIWKKKKKQTKINNLLVYLVGALEEEDQQVTKSMASQSLQSSGLSLLTWVINT